QRIIIAIAILMALWYVGGTWYNRRRGIRTLTWLREGLQRLGGRLEMAWIGSAASGARAVVSKANPPFRQLEAIFLLESREILPLWVINRLRGRRDELIIKAQLRSPRRGEIEVVPAGSRLERSLRRDEQAPWEWEEGPYGLRIARRGLQGKALGQAVGAFLQDYGAALYRLSWRRSKPHLLLHLRLSGLIERPASDLFNALRTIFTHPRQGSP
ncbi:MAG: hypothetical protein D6759_00330, partial [Chloroflexi bacterium]